MNTIDFSTSAIHSLNIEADTPIAEREEALLKAYSSYKVQTFEPLPIEAYSDFLKLAYMISLDLELLNTVENPPSQELIDKFLLLKNAINSLLIPPIMGASTVFSAEMREKHIALLKKLENE